MDPGARRPRRGSRDARRAAIACTLALAACACDARRAPAGAPGEGTAEPPPSPAPREHEAQGPAGTGAVTGRVVYRGPALGDPTMYVPEAGVLEAHTAIVDSETDGLKDAVVWIEGRRGAPAARRDPAVIDQRNWTFVPHVLAVRAGQEVEFLNSDAANHNVHSWSPGNAFNLGATSGEAVSHRFHRPTPNGPLRIGCDIHSWMLAWIYVFEHGAFAVTDARGTFRIEGVPAGTWTLRAHHADGTLEGSLAVEVAPGEEARVELELRAAPARRG